MYLSLLDVFEFIYFARPDSILLDKSVYEVRKNLGMQLAIESKIKADIVVPVPDSAIPSAIGTIAFISRSNASVPSFNRTDVVPVPVVGFGNLGDIVVSTNRT